MKGNPRSEFNKVGISSTVYYHKLVKDKHSLLRDENQTMKGAMVNK